MIERDVEPACGVEVGFVALRLEVFDGFLLMRLACVDGKAKLLEILFLFAADRVGHRSFSSIVMRNARGPNYRP
jgi:hypothetical protein